MKEKEWKVEEVVLEVTKDGYRRAGLLERQQRQQYDTALENWVGRLGEDGKTYFPVEILAESVTAVRTMTTVKGGGAKPKAVEAR